MAYAAEVAVQRLIPAWLGKLASTIVMDLPTGGSRVESLRGSRRWGTPSDLALLQQFGHSAEEVLARLARHARVCILEETGELIAYVWFQRGRFEDRDLRLRYCLDDNEFWLFDAMVAPSRRGLGIYALLLAAASADLALEGCKRIWISLDAGNGNSLRAHRRAGARPLKVIVTIRFLSWMAIRCDGLWRLRWIPADSFWDLRLDAHETSA